MMPKYYFILFRPYHFLHTVYISLSHGMATGKSKIIENDDNYHLIFLSYLIIADAKNIKEEKSNRKIFFSRTTSSAPNRTLMTE